MTQKAVIIIVGPTASGKTSLAVELASFLNAEIISADSRQVFKEMDIGTGKDLAEYQVRGKSIKAHLIDIKSIGDRFSVAEFQTLASKIIEERGENNTVICGGTAYYIKALVLRYAYTGIPQNETLRSALAHKSHADLLHIFKQLPPTHYTSLTDTSTWRRSMRAIEICEFINQQPGKARHVSPWEGKMNFKVFGISVEAERRRDNIYKRLEARLGAGLIEEVKNILERYDANILLNYGLEYKYITLYLLNKLGFAEMKEKLFVEICRYGKRQMTFLRHMEKCGVKINWLDGTRALQENLSNIIKSL